MKTCSGHSLQQIDNYILYVILYVTYVTPLLNKKKNM